MGLNHTHRIIILVFSISLTVSANESSQSYVPCKPGWYLFGEKCYNMPNRGLISIVTNSTYYVGRPNSAVSCAKYGGHLASIHSNELQEFLTVFLLLKLKTNVRIGLQANRKGMNFYWDDGTIYNYTNWDNQTYQESSPYTVEKRCVQMLYTNFRDGIGKWSRTYCFHPSGFICQTKKNDNEKSPDPRFCSLEEGGGWKYQNSCYHIVNEEKSWEDAENYCEERYRGYLVSVLDDNSELFLNYIQRFSNFSKNFWMGIKMKDHSMQKWTSGWHVAYNKFNQKSLQFVSGTCALKSNQNSWAIVPCRNKYPFICEKIKYNVPVLKRPPSDYWKCPNSSKEWLDLDGDFCYYIETRNSRSWTEANNECGRIGGTLASFHSKAETNILHPHVLDEKERLWIGLKRSFVKEFNGLYDGFDKWADGTEVIYRNWAWENFDPLPKEWYPILKALTCVSLWTKTMKWNFHSCEVSKGYICKSKKVLSEMKEISTPKDQAYSGCVPAGTVVGIIFILLVILLVGIIVYHSRNFWKRSCVKTENDGFTSLGHVSQKVIWKPLFVRKGSDLEVLHN